MNDNCSGRKYFIYCDGDSPVTLNELIDRLEQKAGISGVYRCHEHRRIIWHQIHSAKLENWDLHMVFLDLTNAFGCVSSIVDGFFDFYRVLPLKWSEHFFLGIVVWLTKAEIITAWQHLETGMKAGWIILPLCFVMILEVIIQASRWVVVGGSQRKGCTSHPSGHMQALYSL